MCGLVALITNKNNGLDNEGMGILSHAMFLNQLRGNDSTGMFSVGNDKVLNSLKTIGGSTSLYQHKDWEALRNRIWTKGKAIIGHGRAATRGTVIEENAHPFVVPKKHAKDKNITFVHNGTLTAWQQLPGFNDHVVDSNWLAHCLAEFGPEETFGKMNGAAACIWYDEEEERLYWYRNKERPLHVVITTSGTMIMASETASLAYLIDKFDLKSKEGILQWLPEHLCWIDHKNLGEAKLTSDIENKVLPRIYAPVVSYQSTFNGPGYYNYSTLTTTPLNSSSSDGYTFLGESYEADVSGIRAGTIVGIKWENGFKIKLMLKEGRSWESKVLQRPHDEDLVEMCLDPTDSNKLRKVFLRGGVRYMSEFPLPPEIIDLPPKNKVVRSRANYQLSDTKFALKRGAKFTTIHAGELIKHRVLSGNDTPTSFVSYQNARDGKWKVGQEGVVMEVYRVDPRTSQVMGFLVDANNKQSTCIDVFFDRADIDCTVDELETIGVFSGTIKSINLVDDAYHTAGGTVVNVTLTNITPLGELPKIQTQHPLRTCGNGLLGLN